MLQKIRTSAVDNPFALKLIMGIIALAFVFSIGWGFSQQSDGGGIVARVNGSPITDKEFKIAYRNAYDSYRDIFKEKFDDKLIEQLDLRKNVLETLISREMWSIVADDMDISVSKQEIKDSIMQMNVFFENEKFSPSLYKKLLSSNRIKPRDFESNIKSDIMIKKAQSTVRSSVALTDEEIQKALEGQDNLGKEDQQKMIASQLARKQERATISYIESKKKDVKIERFL